MRTASLGDVAHAADNHTSAVMWGVESNSQLIMALVAAVNLHDRTVELIREVIGSQIECPRDCADSQFNLVDNQFGQYANFNAFHSPVSNQICPIRQIDGDFPLAAFSRN